MAYGASTVPGLRVRGVNDVTDLRRDLGSGFFFVWTFFWGGVQRAQGGAKPAIVKRSSDSVVLVLQRSVSLVRFPMAFSGG